MNAESKWHFDPFSEPHSFFAKWDLSALLALEGLSSNAAPAHTASSGPAPEVEDTEVVFDPFPEPRTMPSQWNLTELF